jgi:hypothetical protein
MKLGLYNAPRQKLDVIRDLSPDEINENEKYRPIIAEARNRLVLFRILGKNYKEWQDYLKEILNPKFSKDAEIDDELNRLLLNYLTCAYTIREHFENSFQQRFRHDPKKREELKAFVKKLCANSWPFAFYLDFRGFVQHVGLAVGSSNRQVNRASVSIEITADSKQLTAESREWEYSGLKANRGPVDLIETLEEFHIQMIQNYATYVVRTFFPELLPASEFYERLTEEVKARDPFARMFFFPKFSEEREGIKTKVHVEFVQVPNDLFAELNIHFVKKKTSETK